MRNKLYIFLSYLVDSWGTNLNYLLRGTVSVINAPKNEDGFRHVKYTTNPFTASEF